MFVWQFDEINFINFNFIVSKIFNFLTISKLFHGFRLNVGIPLLNL